MTFTADARKHEVWKVKTINKHIRCIFTYIFLANLGIFWIKFITDDIHYHRFSFYCRGHFNPCRKLIKIRVTWSSRRSLIYAVLLWTSLCLHRSRDYIFILLSPPLYYKMSTISNSLEFYSHIRDSRWILYQKYFWYLDCWLSITKHLDLLSSYAIL